MTAKQTASLQSAQSALDAHDDKPITPITRPDGKPASAYFKTTLWGQNVELIKTPFYFLTKSEHSAKRDEGNPAMFQVPYSEETGVFRDCPACHGYGFHPRDDVKVPQACGFCLVAWQQAPKAAAPAVDPPAPANVIKADFRPAVKKRAAVPPPVDPPAPANVIKADFRPAVKKRAAVPPPVDPPAAPPEPSAAPAAPPLEEILATWKQAAETVAVVKRSGRVAFIYECTKCGAHVARQRDPGMGSWDRPGNFLVMHCKTPAKYVGTVDPDNSPDSRPIQPAPSKRNAKKK